MCRQLAERKAITTKDAQLMIAATSPAALSAPAPEAVKNVMRARILRSMLLCVAQRPAEASSEVNHHEV